MPKPIESTPAEIACFLDLYISWLAMNKAINQQDEPFIIKHDMKCSQLKFLSRADREWRHGRVCQLIDTPVHSSRTTQIW